MLRRIYSRFIGNSFFVKIILLFSIVVASSLFFAGWFISNKVSYVLTQKELNYSSQITKRMSNYLNNKEKSIKQIFFNLYYSNRSFYEYALTYLKSEASNDIASKRTIEEYLNTVNNSDSDILDVILYKNLDSSLYTASKTSRLLSYNYDFINQDWFKKIKKSGNELYIVPTYKPDYILTNNSDVITFGANIFDISMSSHLSGLGTLLINFDVANFKNAFDVNEVLKGFILVLTPDGKVVYNSAGDFTGQYLPYFDRLLSAKNEITIDQEYVVTLDSTSSKGFIVASIIPKKDIYEEVNSINNMILTLIVVIIIFSIFITMLWTKLLTRRIKTITKSMKQVEMGIFNSFIEIKGSDEIDVIARSFNKMCIELKSHIDEVYVSHIKKNSAELKALQAQINPHFLFNTLESLRMKAALNSDMDVANMIYMLSSLFRWSIKNKKSIVSVKEELSHVQYYLELQKMRLGARLDYLIDVPDDLYNCEIIKFTLQPLLENSIQHGIGHLPQGGNIKLGARRDGHDIIFEVSDDGPGMEDVLISRLNSSLGEASDVFSESIGLRNVNDRIKLTFGQAYGLEIKKPETGAIISVRIPAKEMEGN